MAKGRKSGGGGSSHKQQQHINNNNSISTSNHNGSSSLGSGTTTTTTAPSLSTTTSSNTNVDSSTSYTHSGPSKVLPSSSSLSTSNTTTTDSFTMTQHSSSNSNTGSPNLDQSSRSINSTSGGGGSNGVTITTNQNTHTTTTYISLYDWIIKHEGIYFLCYFMLLGFLFGFIIGFIPPIRIPVQNLYSSINHFQSSSSSTTMSVLRIDRIHTFLKHPIRSLSDFISNSSSSDDILLENEYYYNPMTNTRIIFSILREAVVREFGGYVHRDLGIMIPAPCGTIRGLGMITNTYYMCQQNCFDSNHPIVQQQQQFMLLQQQQQNNNNNTIYNHNNNNNSYSDENVINPTRTTYRQDEILIRVPLSFQMTRNLAIETFRTLIPQEVQEKANMEAFDDSMYLTLLLAHERGIGKYSKWLPYIASLPREPSCGYSIALRHLMLNAIEAYRIEWDVDTNGWGEELYKAFIYAERIVENLNTNFGSYIESPTGISTKDNLRWALCHVVSRGIAGSSLHGMLRLVPVVDLINHDGDAGGIIELEGYERKVDGYFIDAVSEMDNGTFVIRSMRHGRLRPLRIGQELMVNYNVPYYTPLDWFVYSGFVPPERTGPWIKMDAVLPPVRRDGPFAYDYGDPDDWKRREEQLLQRVKEASALYDH